MSESTCAEVLARTLRDAGVEVMFGLPGGEILDFLEAARQAGIRFVLTRHEATAAFMADVTGQILRRPGVCVSTLGPGAVNMTLGVANAYLDWSPLVAITASLLDSSCPRDAPASRPNAPSTGHSPNRPCCWMVHDTAAKVRRALDESTALRMGPVHIALPSDVGRSPSHESLAMAENDLRRPTPPAPRSDIERVRSALSTARRPVIIVGLDVNPQTETAAVRAFVERMGLPTFVTPKAKGIIPEDHASFAGTCAGVAGDSVIVEFLEARISSSASDSSRSNRTSSGTRPARSYPLVRSASAPATFRPRAEAVGDLATTLAALGEQAQVRHDWSADAVPRLRERLGSVLRPAARPRGLSGYELTRALRTLFPRDAILATDVGSIKSITTQAWTRTNR